ncbi:MAG: selenium-dependent molybdenum cofactor biosynthesis protein YqeB [Thermodesulfobacteriota bacterium]
MQNPMIGIKGAGEMASAVAWRLFMANFRKLFMMEIGLPTAIRRAVSFSEALFEKEKTVEGVTAVALDRIEEIRNIWERNAIPIFIDPGWEIVRKISPEILVDAILAKKNLGTRIEDAPLVIGLGPGFTAGIDVHMVIETHRGHGLGRVITAGSAQPDTGIPGRVDGYTSERVIRAPADGIFRSDRQIGDFIKPGEIIGAVSGIPLCASIGGVIRGLIRPETIVSARMKIGDIDPGNNPGFCHTISDKARSISGSVLEGVLRVFHEPSLL